MMKFMLIIRENIYTERTEEALKEVIQLHRNWYAQLASSGHAIDGNGLSEKGFLLEQKNNEIIIGSIRDTAEGIGGYYVIHAKDMYEAITLAKECPTYTMGDKIEVRQIM